MLKKIFLSFLLFLLLVMSSPASTFAESSYVLPYPSFMPGNILYKPRLILNKISSFIYFGDFGKFDYNLKEADHYLVEAKTLFEYKQYLLATAALKKSDGYFQSVNPNLINARKNGKNTIDKESLLKEAAIKHMETLGFLKNQLPDEFSWSPENSEPIMINLSNLINNSIKVRSNIL